MDPYWPCYTKQVEAENVYRQIMSAAHPTRHHNRYTKKYPRRSRSRQKSARKQGRQFQ